MMTSHHETKAFVEMADLNGPRLVRLPGLDGLRGIAVAAVVLYHMGFGWMVGGYLGVSTFFTLSGFLITSILLNESIRSGRPSLARFWSRRFRRLMPAALVTLALVAVLFARTVATADQRLAIRGDVLSSLFYVANWRFILAGSTYGDFTASPSPVLHFWSLSIEEQYYVLFPLLIWGLWRLARGRKVLLGVGLGMLALLSGVLPWFAGMGTNRAYLGSDVRAGEILIGGVLAVVLSHRGIRRHIAVRYQIRTVLLLIATVCAAIQIYWFVTVEQTSPWLYRGGLPLFAVMSSVLITAAALPVGPFRAVLGTMPFGWLGTRSYGIYLIHWPLLLAARQLFPHASNTLRGVSAVAVTLLLAEVSFRFVESPVRLGRWPTKGVALRVAGLSFAAVSIVALLPIPVNRQELATDFDKAADQLRELQDGISPSTSTGVPTSSTTSTAPTTTVPAPPEVPKLSIFGDSTSVLASLGFANSIKYGTTTQLAYSGGDAKVGCGVSRFQYTRALDVSTPNPECFRWPVSWAASINDTHPDIAMILTGPWELTDAKIPGNGTWTAIGEPLADDFIRSELDEAVRTTSADGALTILWLWPPYAPWADDMGRPAVARQHDLRRMERLHQIMREVADAHPDSVQVFDLSEYLGPERLADRSMRPDGLHIPSEKMQELFANGLSERIREMFVQWWYSQRR